MAVLLQNNPKVAFVCGVSFASVTTFYFFIGGGYLTYLVIVLGATKGHMV
jgi:hypothetical protein